MLVIASPDDYIDDKPVALQCVARAPCRWSIEMSWVLQHKNVIPRVEGIQHVRRGGDHRPDATGVVGMAVLGAQRRGALARS